MKKSMKTGLVVGGLLFLGAGITWLVKKSIKTCKELEKREEENRKILKESGVVTATKVNEVEECDVIVEDEDGTKVDVQVNLPKKLNEDLNRDADFDIETADVEKFMHINGQGKGRPSEHVIHVLQRYDRGIKRNVLDILFEIPISAQWTGKAAQERSWRNDGSTCAGDFIRDIRGVMEGDTFRKSLLHEEIEDLVNNKEVLGKTIEGKNAILYTGLTSYLLLDYEEKEDGKWIEKTSLIEVPRDLYVNNPINPTHNKQTDLIVDIRDKIGDYNSEEEGFPLDMSKYISNPHNYRNFSVINAFSTVRFTIKIQDCMNLDGINSEILKKVMKRILTSDFEVKGASGGVFHYDNCMCYVPDVEGDIYVYGLGGKKISI